MNIDELIASRPLAVEKNRHESDSTIGRNMLAMSIANPGIDNLVINATGKKTGLPFITALQNGGYYQNNTFFGGNMLFGEGNPLMKKTGTGFLHNKGSLGGYKAQYYNNSSTEITEEMTKKALKGDKDFIIQSGYGFSKDYTGFFKNLNDTGFDLDDSKAIYTYKPKEYMKGSEAIQGKNTEVFWNKTASKIKDRTQYDNVRKILNGETLDIDINSDEMLDRVYRTINPNNTSDVVLNNWKENVRNGNIDISKFSNMTQKDRFRGEYLDSVTQDLPEKKTIREIRSSLNGGEDIQMQVTKHIENLSDEQVLDLAENSRFGRNTRRNLKEFNRPLAKDVLNISNGKGTVKDIQKVFSVKDKMNIYDEYTRALGQASMSQTSTANKIRTVNSLIKEGYTDENSWKALPKNLKKTMDTMLKNKTANNIKNINNIREGIIKDVGSEFFERTGFQKLMSSRPMQIATGNYISASASIPLAIATGFVSAGAVQHQEQSVNNFRGLFSHDNTAVLDYHSQEAVLNSYQHTQLSTSNSQDIQYIKNNRNIASNYANSIAPVEIDKSLTKIKNFTTM